TRSYGAAAFINARFEDYAAGGGAGISAKFAEIAEEQNHPEQAREIGFGLGGDLHHHGIAAPFLRHQAAIGELALHALGLRVRLIHFVDGNNDGHTRGAGMRVKASWPGVSMKTMRRESTRV